MQLRCPFNLIVEKLVHDSNVVDQIQDELESFQLPPYTLFKTPVVENPVLIQLGCIRQKELQSRTFVTLLDSLFPALHLLKFRRERKT